MIWPPWPGMNWKYVDGGTGDAKRAYGDHRRWENMTYKLQLSIVRQMCWLFSSFGIILRFKTSCE